MLAVCTLAQRILRELRQCGTTAKFLEDMLSVQNLFAIMDLQEFLALDAKWVENVSEEANRADKRGETYKERHQGCAEGCWRALARSSSGLANCS